ncbi:MAG: cytochrome c biogenesis protein CcdA [Brotaphodocola sp.]
MGFSIDVSISVVTVLIQGLLSFFSPCVLPLLPLYIGYLSGGTGVRDEVGRIHYNRSKVMVHTVFFAAGIGFAFFLLGLGMSAVGMFFQSRQVWFARIGGILVILFGCGQLDLFGTSVFGKEHRLPFQIDKFAMSPITALLMGFTFSFAWTPCVGPALTSVLLMAASAETRTAGFVLIGVYTLGFVLPFLAVGLFTTTLLGLFKKHRNVVRYTVKIGGVLMICMGVMMLTGRMNEVTEPLSDTAEESEAVSLPPAIDFELNDQFGNVHKLEDYKGKTIFLNFWATWCPPCRAEMPDIQNLYETYETEGDDALIVLGVAAPNLGQEGSEEEIADFLKSNGYTYPVLMDANADLFMSYGISFFPTTFMIDREGKIFGYVSGMLTRDMMENIIEQTMSGERK